MQITWEKCWTTCVFSTCWWHEIQTKPRHNSFGLVLCTTIIHISHVLEFVPNWVDECRQNRGRRDVHFVAKTWTKHHANTEMYQFAPLNSDRTNLQAQASVDRPLFVPDGWSMCWRWQKGMHDPVSLMRERKIIWITKAKDLSFMKWCWSNNAGQRLVWPIDVILLLRDIVHVNPVFSHIDKTGFSCLMCVPLFSKNF